MASWHRHVGLLGLLFALAASFAAAQQPSSSPRPVPKGRVFVWDVEGTWISKAYLEQLQATRSPHAAGTRTPPLVIKVQREERSYHELLHPRCPPPCHLSVPKKITPPKTTLALTVHAQT